MRNLLGLSQSFGEAIIFRETANLCTSHITLTVSDRLIHDSTQICFFSEPRWELDIARWDTHFYKLIYRRSIEFDPTQLFRCDDCSKEFSQVTVLSGRVARWKKKTEQNNGSAHHNFPPVKFCAETIAQPDEEQCYSLSEGWR